MIRPLTSLRFLAALAVLGSHLDVLGDSDSLGDLWQRVLAQGYAGVTFFFILSGFILTFAYTGRIERSRTSIGSYLAARVGRIWPVHLLTLVLAVPIGVRAAQGAGDPLLGGTFLGTFVANVFLMQPYVPSEHVYFSFNSPSWSLGNELLFYALLPVLLIGVARAAAPRIRTVAAVGIGAWSLGLIATIAGRNLADAHWLFYVNPGFRLIDFAIGVCLALVFQRLRTSEPIAAGAETSAKWTIAEFGAVGAVALSVFASAHVPTSVTYGALYQPAFAATVFVFAVARGRISSLLSHRACVYLGEISFSFYMLHILVIGYLGVFIGTGAPITFSVVTLALTLIGSALVHRFYEDPLRLRIARAAKVRLRPIASPLDVSTWPLSTRPITAHRVSTDRDRAHEVPAARR